MKSKRILVENEEVPLKVKFTCRDIPSSTFHDENIELCDAFNDSDQD